MALTSVVSCSGRWSSQRMTLRSSPSLVNEGPVTETGSSVSWVKTQREQVASKPRPLTFSGATPESASTRRTQEVMRFQMSVVDCSWRR